MTTKKQVIIVEDTLFFKKGQLLESFKRVDDGIEDKEGNFLAEGKYVMLTEKLSQEDEKKVKDLIKLTLKGLLWNMFTKENILIPNI